MARSEARIQVSIWADPDFRAMSPGAQWTYMFLLSQPDLGYHGVMPLRITKWARSARDLTVAKLRDDLDELDQHEFIVIDPNTEEVLVRSLIRGDEVYRQPSLMHNAAANLPHVESRNIRLRLAIELGRIIADAAAGTIPPIPRGSVAPMEKMLALLGAPTPEGIADAQVKEANDPSPKGAGKGSPKGADHPTPKGSPEGLGIGDRGSTSLTVRTTKASNLSRPRSASPPTDPPPEPDPKPEPEPEPRTRPDVDELCHYLADAIEANGSRRPTIAKGWRTAARLMLDRDGRTVEQIKRAIDWCQRDDFWRGNVMSMPKLRQKYDQLRLQAARGQGQANRGAPGTDLATVTSIRKSTADLRMEAGFELGQLFDQREQGQPS